MIRIHSGENLKDETGIKDVLSIIKEEANHYGNTYPKIRIGHAIHGINEETAKLMKEMDVAVDFNFASNEKLGYIEKDGKDKYVENTVYLCDKYGIREFLGTDGAGMYQSNPFEQIEIAQKYEIDLMKMIYNENNYLQDMQEPRKKIEAKHFGNGNFKIPHMRLSKKLEVQEVRLFNEQKKVPPLPPIPIGIAGGSFKTRSKGNFDEYKTISICLQVLADIVDPKKCYFVTGGTNCGPERFAFDAIRNSKKGTRCVGLIPYYLGLLEDPNAGRDFNKIEKETTTDVLLLKDCINGWDRFSDFFIKAVNGEINHLSTGNRPKEKGCCIFIGGGQGVKDEITLAKNKDIPSFCFDGFGDDSASSLALKEKNDNIHKFDDAESLIKEIYEVLCKEYGKNIFVKDFEIDKISEYIKEAKKVMNLDYQIFGKTLIDEGRYTEGQLKRIRGWIEEDDMESIYDIYGKDEDLELFIDAYRTWYKNKNANELPFEFDKDITASELERANKLAVDKTNIEKEGI